MLGLSLFSKLVSNNFLGGFSFANNILNVLVGTNVTLYRFTCSRIFLVYASQWHPVCRRKPMIFVLFIGIFPPGQRLEVVNHLLYTHTFPCFSMPRLSTAATAIKTILSVRNPLLLLLSL